MQELHDNIIELQQKGELKQALTLCDKAIAEFKEVAEFYHLKALILIQNDNYMAGKDFLLKAIDIKPDDPRYYNHLGNVLLKLGNTEEALKNYYYALKLNPKSYDTYNNLGNLFFRQGKFKEAKENYNRALMIAPRLESANFNLANILSMEENFSQAQSHYQFVLNLNPKHHRALYNIGLIQRMRGNLKDALKTFWDYLELQPNDADGYYYLAITYTELGAFDEAIAQYEKLLKLKPNHKEALYNIATLYHKNNAKDLALDFYQKAYLADESNNAAKFMISALSETNDATKAPNEYLKFLFDQYAINYDEHLLYSLKFSAPKQIADFLKTSLKPKENSLTALDIGCGSGLIGKEIKTYCKKLIGVDLSSKMLVLAQRTNLYDDLICNDFNQYLNASKSFDLIIASEVFIYFGDLLLSFTNIYNSLNVGGNFIFTVEKYDGKDYKLNKSGRFSHSEKYIRKIASKLGFKINTIKATSTRLHEGEENAAYLVALSRTS